MAFVRLKNGHWYGGYYHPVTKRNVMKKCDNETAADIWGTDEERKAKARVADEAEAQAPTPATPDIWRGPTIAEYGRAYLDRRGGLLAQNTRNKYASFLNGLAIPVGRAGALAERRIGTLRRADIEQWMSDSLTAGVGRPSINGRLAFLRLLYNDINADRDTPVKDPTRGIKKLPEEITDDRIVKKHEEPGLFEVADDQLHLAMLIALDAGLRWGEVYALRAGAIQPGAKTDADFISVTQVIEKNRLRAYPKGKHKRTVATSHRLALALEKAIEGKDDHDLLFTGPTGRPVNYDNWLKRVWAPTLHKAGLAKKIEVPTNPLRIAKTGPNAGKPIMQVRYQPDFGFHQLRHTYGSRLAGGSMPRTEIARLMGHADERTTGRYIHAGDDGRRLTLVRDILGRRTRDHHCSY